jgi:hypothetical protein
MKYDNLSHFIYYYLSHQSYSIPQLTVLLEHDIEFDGNWLENISIDSQRNSTLFKSSNISSTRNKFS